MALVLDASIVLSWYFADENSPKPAFIDRLTDEPVIVPAHFEAEVANGVLVGERRSRSDPSQAANLLDFMQNMQPEVDAGCPGGAIGQILPLARAHRLTVYDAIYLELAERRGFPLATRDGPLAVAARSVGVEVLGE